MKTNVLMEQVPWVDDLFSILRSYVQQLHSQMSLTDLLCLNLYFENQSLLLRTHQSPAEIFQSPCHPEKPSNFFMLSGIDGLYFICISYLICGLSGTLNVLAAKANESALALSILGIKDILNAEK